jgi:hypothetical protein
MKVSYLQPITDDILIKKLRSEIGEEILHCNRIFSTHKKVPYEIKNELDMKYLEHAKRIIIDVSDFIRDFLPRFFSPYRADFDYVRRYNVEFLSRHELFVKVRAKTDKEEKELSLCFNLPSFVYLPRILYIIKGQYMYLHNHLESRISFVIGNQENPKTDDYFIEDALEEFWHLAIHPYLIEKLNRNLRMGAVKPENSNMSNFLMEGETVAKAFAFVSSDEFKKKKGYNIPSREPEIEKKFLFDKIRSMGIKKAFKRSADLEFYVKG